MSVKTAFLLIALLAASIPVDAASIVLSRAAILENDSLDWAVLGPPFTEVPNGTAVLTPGGLTVTVSTSTATSMERRDAGNGWGTGSSFPGGTPLLWTRNEDTASLIIDFSSPVLAAGTNVGRDNFGNYTAYVEAFRGATSLGVFSVPGDANDDIPFLGVFDAGGITRLAYNVDLNTEDFAINQLSIRTGVIPEPGTIVIVGAGLLSVAVWRRRRA
jgi:hypothetical protein